MNKIKELEQELLIIKTLSIELNYSDIYRQYKINVNVNRKMYKFSNLLMYKIVHL